MLLSTESSLATSLHTNISVLTHQPDKQPSSGLKIELLVLIVHSENALLSGCCGCCC
jgi:hypothetical protein